MAALPQQGAAPLAPLRGYPCTPTKTVHPPLASVPFLRVLLSYPGGDTHSHLELELEKEIEKEIEKEREGETGHLAPAAYGRYNNVILTDTELSGLKTELPDKWEYYIDRLSCHIASTGKQYHSHAATIYKWAQEDAAKGKAAPKQGIPDYSCKEGESL